MTGFCPTCLNPNPGNFFIFKIEFYIFLYFFQNVSVKSVKFVKLNYFLYFLNYFNFSGRSWQPGLQPCPRPLCPPSGLRVQGGPHRGPTCPRPVPPVPLTGPMLMF